MVRAVGGAPRATQSAPREVTIMPAIDENAVAESLLRQGLINEVQLDEAREEAHRSGGNLMQTLLRLGYVSAHEIAQAVESAASEPAGLESVVSTGLPEVGPAAPSTTGGPVSLSSYDIDPAAVRALPRTLAEEHQVLPISISDERILLAMADTSNVLAIDAVRLHTRRRVEPVQVDPAELAKAIEHYYTAAARARAAVAQKARDLSAAVVDISERPGVDHELLGMLDQAPIVRVVEGLVREAVRQNASDIHIEPRHDRVQVRYRIDGVLQTQTNLRKDMHQYILSRVKILAGEDISETRKPQSGRFEIIFEDRPIDLRVSTIPTFWGEKAVLRLLDKSRVFVSLTQLGFLPETMEQFERLLRLPQGLILVTGPTGSGKSTTRRKSASGETCGWRPTPIPYRAN